MKQTVGLPLGPEEGDGERFAHVRHNREVDEFPHVKLIVQPPPVHGVVRCHQREDLSVAGLFRLHHLILELVELHPTAVAAFAGLGPLPGPPADHSAEREDKPPVVSDKIEEGIHRFIVPPAPFH
ncbi:hypothetical protein ACVWY0_002733 [Arthrobacter sp. UYNi723]